LLARSQRPRQLSHMCLPKSFHGRLSHRSAPSRLTSLIRNSLKTTSFRLLATSSISPVRPQNRLGPPSEPKFRFWFGLPQNCGFGFKTDPGLITKNVQNVVEWRVASHCNVERCGMVRCIAQLLDNSRIRQLADCQLADWTTRGCHRRLCVLSFPFWPASARSRVVQSATCPLRELSSARVVYRRLRGDMIEVFKITHNLYDPEVSPELRHYPKSNTRGNKYKLLNHTFHYDTQKYSFTARIVNIWNSLPNSVVDVDVDTVCLFFFFFFLP